MHEDMNKTAPGSFSSSDPRQAMHSKDARLDADKEAARRSEAESTIPGTAIIPVGPVFDASSETMQSVIRQHKFSTIFLAGLMGFAIGAALGR
ncbi:hypothetical protein PY365_06940 [Roseiarcaceae bacterium H3SJ34-1]|uniref:hypothetical protein n=1 Tax=Terripilifer ovatus TaxID=3032367 RepID=UPI003AB95545|nr:hypothetical protein [Roseiarcaceae bacterium H3SJ34-1]